MREQNGWQELSSLLRDEINLVSIEINGFVLTAVGGDFGFAFAGSIELSLLEGKFGREIVKIVRGENGLPVCIDAFGGVIQFLARRLRACPGVIDRQRNTQ